MTYLPDMSAATSLGADGSDGVTALIAQVNRFGPSAPAGYRYVPTPFAPATGTVPLNVAVAAVFLLLRRAQDALIKYGDTGSEQLFREATNAHKDPQGYVQSHLASVTEQLAQFANSIGAPSASGFFDKKVAGVPLYAVVLGVGGVLALGSILRSRKASR